MRAKETYIHFLVLLGMRIFTERGKRHQDRPGDSEEGVGGGGRRQRDRQRHAERQRTALAGLV